MNNCADQLVQLELEEHQAGCLGVDGSLPEGRRLKTLCAGAVRSLRVVVTLFWAAAGFFLSKFQDSVMRFGTEAKPTGCQKDLLFFFYSPSRLLSSLNISSLSSHFLCLSLTHQCALDPPTLPPLLILLFSPSPPPFLPRRLQKAKVSITCSLPAGHVFSFFVLFFYGIREAALKRLILRPHQTGRPPAWDMTICGRWFGYF